MSDVRAVLFDLDDTLFDHSHATEQALARLRRAEPALAAWTSEELQARHGAVLETLHQEVLAGALSIDAAREERFRRLLTAAASSELAARRAAVVAASVSRQLRPRVACRARRRRVARRRSSAPASA